MNLLVRWLPALITGKSRGEFRQAKHRRELQGGTIRVKTCTALKDYESYAERTFSLGSF